MPKVYHTETFLFIMVDEDDDGNGYYDIIHCSGVKWDYAHKFSSIAEMKAYEDTHA